jgi:hypothetical protein
MDKPQQGSRAHRRADIRRFLGAGSVLDRHRGQEVYPALVANIKRALWDELMAGQQSAWWWRDGGGRASGRLTRRDRCNAGRWLGNLRERAWCGLPLPGIISWMCS